MINKSGIKKNIIIALLCSVISGAIMFSGCTTTPVDNNENSSNNSQTSQNSQNSQNSQTSNSNGNNVTLTESVDSTVSFDDDEINAVWDESNAATINLENSKINISGNGAAVNGTTLTISSAGTYVINGTLDDGQIVINAGKDDVVKLVLNNASISSSSAPAIYAEKAGKTIIILADGTTNTLSDGSDYYTESSETSTDTETDTTSSPNAAIFCQDDLTITGNGTLNVTGNAHNGITSKDILRIANGTINISAQNHGMTGRDNLAIIGGTINITALGDGMRSTYAETDDSSKGHIFIENAVIEINSGNDGIQAEKDLIINSGTISITTGGGSDGVVQTNNDFGGGFFGSMQPSAGTTSTVSRKALKSGSYMTINDGTFSIDSYDDAIHCNSNVEINGGTFDISAGDDAIHADDTLSIQNGSITVSSSYEGLEGNIINISGGIIDITASDDGINAAGGNDSSGFGGGRPQDNFNTSSGNTAQLNISGGTLYVNADGDGVDSNATLTISGGTIVVNGTTSGGNGIIDHDGNCTITGGTLIGSGTSDMLEMPDSSSTQNSVAVTFSSTQSAGTLVYITDADGNILTAMTPLKNFSCVIFSSSMLESGQTYSVYLGGTADGDSVNGYYSKASITDGTKYTEFTISDSVTYVNQNGVTGSTGGMGGSMTHGGMGGGRMF